MVKVFRIAGERYIARGYSESGQLMISSVSHRDPFAGANEIAEWCLANRPDWRVSLANEGASL